MGVIDFVKDLFVFTQKNQDGSYRSPQGAELTTKSYENILDTDCDQIVETSFQMEELKIEYQLVTSYLSDIQTIEQLPEEKRQPLNDAASAITALSNERMLLKETGNRMSNVQFRNIRLYDKEIPNIISRIKEVEEYQSIVKGDMRQLEGEKGALEYEEEECCERQNGLRAGMVSLVLMVAIAAVLLFGLSQWYDYNLQLPILLVLLLGVVAGVVLILCFRSRVYELKMNRKKYNRAITLLNKVKVKYVNTTSELEYLYQKYNVGSQRELSYLWEQYQKAVEEEKRFKENASNLHGYQEMLVESLRINFVKDPSVWVNQAAALVDNREMVEVKHHLNDRRQKLRDQMEYNETIKKQCFEEIREIIEKKPDLKEYVVGVLAGYNINL